MKTLRQSLKEAYARLTVYNLILLLTSFCLLTACGGGSNSSSPVTATVTAAANAAASNVSSDSTSTSNNTASIAARVFLSNDGQTMLVFKASNRGYKYANNLMTTSYTGYSSYVSSPFSWNSQGNTVSLTTSEGKKTYELALVGKVITDGTQADTYTLALPLSLANLDGKHLLQRVSLGDSCSGRSLSFSGSSLIIREQCRGVFNQIELTTEMVEGVDNLIHAYGSYAGYQLSYYIALSAGSVDGQSKWVIRAERNGTAPPLSSDYHLNMVLEPGQPMMQALTFNPSSSPIFQTSGDFVASLFSKTTRAGCDLFNTSYFTCPGDYYWQDVNTNSCIFSAPIWLVKNGGIACLTDPVKRLANHPFDPITNGVDGRASVIAYRFTYNGVPESELFIQE